MKVRVLAVGRSKAPFIEAQAHYLKLLAPRLPVEVVEARDDARLEGRVNPDARIICLDERGRPLDSHEWAAWLEARRLDARAVDFLIGGPSGLPPSLMDRADEVVSFGPQTVAHQLARILLLEQLFRAAKIAAGEPYHL